MWAVRYFRPYLLGHPCTVYTDHAACLAILNTPKPSGKLARWALTIQEMDLTIKHKAGKKNTNADVLSRVPKSQTSQVIVGEQSVSSSTPQLASQPTPQPTVQSILPDSEEISKLQREDDDCAQLNVYLEGGVLPQDEHVCRKLILESRHFHLVGGVLYREDPTTTGRNCVVVPEALGQTLLEEAHGGQFAAHLSEKKVYNRLRRHVWWRGMKNDIHTFCRARLECSSWKGGRRTFRPPLQPIPVGSPFHRVWSFP